MTTRVNVGGKWLDRHDAMRQGTTLLWLVREGHVSGWTSLCDWFGVDPDHHALSTDRLGILRTVEALERANLLRVDRIGEARDVRGATFHLSERWHEVQNALGLSLTSLAQFILGKSLVVNPIFSGALRGGSSECDVFVATPFLPELKPILDDHVKPTVEALGLTIARGDDLFGTGSVMTDIWNVLSSARIVIADCTGRNPNVFYELGITHTLGIPAVLLTQDRGDIPFDVRHIRYIKYEFTPRGMRDFESSLASTLISELKLSV